jgi:hypothetical protein
MIGISDNEIVIRLNSFITKNYQVVQLQHLEDIIIENYRGQTLIFDDVDGSNIRLSNFISFVDSIRTALEIPIEKILFKTQIQPQEPYQWVPQRDYYLIPDFDVNQIDKDLSIAKFVGCLGGSRASIMRARMLYKLFSTFGQDTFLTCAKNAYINELNFCKFFNGDLVFNKEIDWIQNTQFNNDMHEYGLDMNNAAHEYLKIWNKFKIEIVMETDEYLKERITDKLAKVLSTGKPFVLLSGKESLQNLRDLGFKTFSDCLDESYDQCLLPSLRIRAIIDSLTKLYNHPNREKIIENMYNIAQENIEVYNKICVMDQTTKMKYLSTLK